MQKPHKIKRLKALLLILAMTLVAVQEASAHRVSVFAWVEGDTVYTQSKFGGGKKAQEAPILVYDLQGNLLLKGQTDDQGEFHFKAPAKVDMKIVLQAGTGHRAEWLVRATEFGDDVSQAGVSTASSSTATAPEAKASDPQASPSTVSGLSADQLRQVVETAIDKKLQPVIHMLVEANTAGPTFKDIIGGIGYIFGLVGVAMYFRYRKEKR
jgi:nickel transport protein